jgi:nitrite reductase/ring-hydroxylating ferredoxin subunit
VKVPLIAVEAIPAEGSASVDFFGREVLVYQVDGVPRAVMNVCMHLGGPLQREGDCLSCAWHGASFNAGDGRRVRGPARAEARLMFLPTRIEGGQLLYVYGE